VIAATLASKLKEVPVRLRELQFCAPTVRLSLKLAAMRTSGNITPGASAARNSALLSVTVVPDPF